MQYDKQQYVLATFPAFAFVFFGDSVATTIITYQNIKTSKTAAYSE